MESNFSYPITRIGSFVKAQRRRGLGLLLIFFLDMEGLFHLYMEGREDAFQETLRTRGEHGDG